MNSRQIKKKLKKIIHDLETDNDLMRRIIADSPSMQELYDLYNKPLSVTNTTMWFQKYKSMRYLPPDKPYDGGLIALFKQEMAHELFESVKDNITYEVNAECITPTITASIVVGRSKE